jgi:hypothetical protein
MERRAKSIEQKHRLSSAEIRAQSMEQSAESRQQMQKQRYSSILPGSMRVTDSRDDGRRDPLTPFFNGVTASFEAVNCENARTLSVLLCWPPGNGKR